MASFFENQDLARRNTKLLVVTYFLAVAGVIIAVDLVLAGAWIYGFADIDVLRGRLRCWARFRPGSTSSGRLAPRW
jgi:hypothetical protein